MPLSRQELADLTGTTIETAIRIMSRWQKDDVAAHREGRLRDSRSAALDDVSRRDGQLAGPGSRAHGSRGAPIRCPRVSRARGGEPPAARRARADERERRSATAAIPMPPVNRSSASDAAPKAVVPSMASSAPVRAASTGLIKRRGDQQPRGRSGSQQRGDAERGDVEQHDRDEPDDERRGQHARAPARVGAGQQRGDREKDAGDRDRRQRPARRSARGRRGPPATARPGRPAPKPISSAAASASHTPSIRPMRIAPRGTGCE